MRELSNIPLAIEQAGALIHNGEYTFQKFHKEYKEEYNSIMAHSENIELQSYDKKRAIVTILDMIYRSLESSPESVALLHFLGVLGSWRIPLILLEKFELFSAGASDGAAPNNLESLRDILCQPQTLRVALNKLAGLSLVRLKKENDRISHLTLHRVLCQWSLAKLSATHRHEYIMQAAYGLAIGTCQFKAGPRLSERSNEINRNYLTAFVQCLHLISDHVPESELDPHSGRFRASYAIILDRAAWAFLLQGLAQESKDHFQLAMAYAASASGGEGDWPGEEEHLMLMYGFSRACSKAGDLDLALETLESALPQAHQHCGSQGEITLDIVSRIRDIRQRQKVMMRHHETARTAARQSKADRPRLDLPNTENDSSQTTVNELILGNGEDAHDLLKACHAGDDYTVAQLLDLPDVEVDQKDVRGRTPLWVASWKGHTTIVELLLAKGADASLKDAYGWTPLAVAAANGLVSVVRVLLESRVDVDMKVGFGRGYTPLFFAASYGHTACVNELLNHSANKYALDDEKGTLLVRALENDRKEVVEQLVREDLNPAEKDFLGRISLHWAARNRAWRSLEFLLERFPDMDVNTQGESGETPLHEASRYDDPKGVQLLVAKGARCDLPDINKRYPQDISAIRRKKSTLEALKGAKGYKTSSLSLSKKNIVEVIISEPLETFEKRIQKVNPDDLNIPSTLDGTPLHQACVQRAIYVVLILEAGADPNRVNSFNQTPLFAAVRRNHADCAMFMLQHGADPNKAPFASPALWEYACEMNHWEVAFKLLEYEAQISRDSVFIPRTLARAASQNNMFVAKRLVEAGGSIHLRVDGYSAIEYAQREGATAVLRYFAQSDGSMTGVSRVTGLPNYTAAQETALDELVSDSH